MRTQYLYIDESGDSGWMPKHGGASSSQHLAYAGIVVDGKQNYNIRKGVENIMQNHFPQPQGRPEELHYADLIHDKGVYDDLSNSECKSIADDVFDLINEVEPILMATVVDKKQMKERYGGDADNPKQYAFRATVDRFNKHLEAHDNVGTVTIDVAEYRFDKQLRRLVFEAQNSGIEISGARKDSSKIPRIMDTVTLSPSEMSPGLQIADFVAYATRHEYEYGGSNRFDEISDLFRDPEGVSLTEPSLVPRR